jgi:hypothetical protein
MTPIQACHASSQELGLHADLQGYMEQGNVERLPASLAMPLIASLSAALWTAIWYVGRSLTGL